jgi:hypothetical protein
MKRRRNMTTFGIVLAVCLVVSAVAAGASIASSWVIESKTLGELALKEESTTITKGPLTLFVEKSNLKVKCNGVKGSGSIVEESKGTTTLELSECIVTNFSGTEEITSCKVITPITLKASSTPVLNSEATVIYDDLTPASGTSFGSLSFEKEKGCVFPAKNELKGSMAWEVNHEEPAKQTLKFSEAIAKAAKTALLFGANAAILVGEPVEELAGANAGKRWGAAFGTLCKKEPTTVGADFVCPAGEAYAGTVTGSLAAEKFLKFSKPGGEARIRCNEAFISGEYGANGRGKLQTVDYEDSEAGAGKCISSFAVGAPEVWVETKGLPATSSQFDYGRSALPQSHDGVMWWAAAPSLLPLEVTFELGVLACVYEVHFSYGFVKDGVKGAATTLALFAEWHVTKATVGNVANCPSELKEDEATMNLARPGGNIYVTK